MTDSEFDASNLSEVFFETIESSRAALTHAVERIMEVLSQMPCAAQNLDGIRIALDEALANAIIHGNREDPEKKVEICGACEGQDRLLLVITDQGQGFDPAAIPDPTVAENIFSTHGRGIFLINRLVDQAEFQAGGRRLLLRKKRTD
jgi:serine/threonine-protein kinase RsbW